MTFFELPEPFWENPPPAVDFTAPPKFIVIDASGIDRWLLPKNSKLAYKQEVSTGGLYKYRIYVYHFPSWLSMDVMVLRVNNVSGTVEDVITFDSHHTVSADEVIFALPALTECLNRHGESDITVVTCALRDTWATATAFTDGDLPY